MLNPPLGRGITFGANNLIVFATITLGDSVGTRQSVPTFHCAGAIWVSVLRCMFGVTVVKMTMGQVI